MTRILPSRHRPRLISRRLSGVLFCLLCAGFTGCGGDGPRGERAELRAGEPEAGKPAAAQPPPSQDTPLPQEPAVDPLPVVAPLPPLESPLVPLAGAADANPPPVAEETAPAPPPPPAPAIEERATPPAPTVVIRPPAASPPAERDAPSAPPAVSPLPDAGTPPVPAAAEARLPAAMPVAAASPAPPVPVVNDLVLTAIRRLPKGGGYAVNRAALTGLRSSITEKRGRMELDPARAQPSFCSGATYLVFLDAMLEWHQRRRLRLPEDQVKRLLVTGQPDGEGVWGRWNANGPGTARLFTELGIGVNFQAWEHALPGDFLKIWWNEHIGKREAGHSVVFLGYADTGDGQAGVRFWSSNQPDGYGEKVVPFSKIKRALFSRLTHPGGLAAALPVLPRKDAFLAEMLTRDCSERELAERTGMTAPPSAAAPSTQGQGRVSGER